MYQLQFNQLRFCVDSNAMNTLYVTTPPANETGQVTIALELNDHHWIVTNLTFEYRSNPVFTDIEPRNHLTA